MLVSVQMRCLLSLPTPLAVSSRDLDSLMEGEYACPRPISSYIILLLGKKETPVNG